MEENKTTLYQWPPALGTESIFPRCVVFQRICNIAHQEVKVVNMKLPRQGANFAKELQERLVGLPVLKVGDQRFDTSQQILQYLLYHPPAKVTKAKLTRLASPLSYLTQQWGNECFINTLVHARWGDEDNYQRFIQGVKWGEELSSIQSEVTLLRQEILRYLKRTPTGGQTKEQFEDQLKSQFFALEYVLSNQTFVEPMVQHPTMTDLYIFMTVQGLLAPDISYLEWIRQECPNVVRWFIEVDGLTKPG